MRAADRGRRPCCDDDDDTNDQLTRRYHHHSEHHDDDEHHDDEHHERRRAPRTTSPLPGDPDQFDCHIEGFLRSDSTALVHLGCSSPFGGAFPSIGDPADPTLTCPDGTTGGYQGTYAFSDRADNLGICHRWVGSELRFTLMMNGYLPATAAVSFELFDDGLAMWTSAMDSRFVRNEEARRMVRSAPRAWVAR